MRVLLTGAAGTVGHHALEQLIDKNYEVTVIELINNKNKKALKNYQDKINLVWGSITDKELVEEVVKDQDAVIHLAGIIPPYADEHPELTRQVNYFGTKNIVEAIKEFNNNCFLMFSSSISVYGDRVKDYEIKVGDELKASEGDYYAYVKIKTEEMIKASDINYTIFRLTAIMDIPKVDPLMFHMPLDTKLEIATARDTARAFVNGIEHLDELNKKIYNLGGGEKCRTTYKDFIKGCFKVYGLNYSHLDETAFAEKNFHCGYYVDGDKLNNIVDFRRDTLDTYYEYLSNNTSKFRSSMAKLLSCIIVKQLNNTSEPRMAIRKNIKSLVKKFFYDKETE